VDLESANAPPVPEVALQRATVALLVLDADKRVSWVNDAACALVDRRPPELLGKSLTFLDTADVTARGGRSSDIWTPLPDPVEWRECRCRQRDGNEFSVLVHSGIVSDATGAAASYVLQMVDPARRRTADSREAAIPIIDTLTGLPTVVLLLDRLQHALARSERSGSVVAVLRLRFEVAKVDGARAVHIHRILLAVSRRLRAALRATDTVARSGEDGFILVFEEIDESEVRTVAGRVIDAVKAPFDIDGRRTPVIIRSGVSVGKAPFTNSQRLLDEAEAAVSQ
jgi:GGDEF domain-containing protein